MEDRYSELLPLHTALKEIVKDFSGVCDELGVAFFLAYGTLLGAARHQDIIPWDDDVDLAMMREDYEKIVRYFIETGVPGYQLYCAETSDEHTQVFAKLVRTDGKYDNLREFFTHPAGLCIDIFPLDEARSQNNLLQRIRGAWILYLRRIVSSRAKLKSKEYSEKRLKKLVRSIMVLPFVFVNNHDLLKHVITICKKGSGKGYSNIISYSAMGRLSIENNPKEFWYPSVDLMLGDDLYCVPGEYEAILSRFYGHDWKELPPEEKRGQHTHFGIIDKQIEEKDDVHYES